MKILLLWTLAIATLFGSIGEVTALKGESQLHRDTVVIEAAVGTEIEEQDLVQTSARSKVQIILDDETIITIGPKSEYLFERYDNSQNPEVIMHLKEGVFKIITGKIGKVAPHRFKIKTNSAVIGIRGTQFMASVSGDNEKIGCSKGALVVETEQTTFELPAGRMLVYENGVWTMYELDRSSFSPVLAATKSMKKAPLKELSERLPSIQESTVIQEQVTDGVHGGAF